MPKPDNNPGPAYYAGPKDADRGVERLIEPHKTYRVPKEGKTTLLRVLKVGDTTITVKDEATGKTTTRSRQSFQNDLNQGKIYVTSSLVKALHKICDS